MTRAPVTLEQLRVAHEKAKAEIIKLKALPLPLQCTFAVELLERWIHDTEIELEDAKLDLVRIESPRHSWLRVPKDEITRLKLTNRISRFSYVDDKYYYLETSCDMRLFLDAREAEGRDISGWEDLEVARFPHVAGIYRLDELPGYISVA